MDDFSTEEQRSGDDRPRGRRFGTGAWVLLLVLFGILVMTVMSNKQDASNVKFTFVLDQIEQGFAEGLVTSHPAMPAFAFRASEIDDLMAYLDVLRAGS